MTSSEDAEPQAFDIWDADALLAKAQRHADAMRDFAKDEWQFGLKSSFVLELIARAALSKIGPVLLSDLNDWRNVLHALGHQPTAPKFTPRSIPVTAVLDRLQELLPELTPELKSLCSTHLNRRNEELHSGASPFDDTPVDRWLPGYYRACEVVLASMGHGLDYVFGSDEAGAAAKMIAAADDNAAKAVLGLVKAHQTVWTKKDQPERDELQKKAEIWATRQDGHRVECPSCKSVARVMGEPISAPAKKIAEDEITEVQEFLPSKFECIACGLKISGLSHLSASGLGAPYKATFIYDAAEYYAMESESLDFYEPDYNEP